MTQNQIIELTAENPAEVDVLDYAAAVAFAMSDIGLTEDEAERAADDFLDLC